MKFYLLKKVMPVIMASAMVTAAVAGCGSSDVQAPAEQQTQETAIEAPAAEDTGKEAVTEDTAAEASTDKAEQGAYFTKGVYVNYAKEAENPDKNYFYIFNDGSNGYTEDGTNGIGLPFASTQEGETVKFTYGGAGEEAEVLTVTSFENGIVTGHFDDGLELVFEPVSDADPDNFSAENYVNGPEDSVYHDANGWSVKYDATRFTVNSENGNVFIVYQGEQAGTNMITVTYTVENKGEAAIKALGESWGSDKVTYNEGPFPGADDVTGYWAMLPPAEDGSGLYETAVGRDYMDGALIFDLTGHNSGDAALDMEVSDNMASIIDSLTFENYSEDQSADASEAEITPMDISGCNTFTEIVDKKLEKGMGYANATIDGTDVLLVSSGTYDNLDGNNAAIDARIFVYKDAMPYEIGTVASCGTAYPLAVKDGKLFTGGNHNMSRHSVKDGTVLVSENAYENFDSDGNATYSYSSGEDNLEGDEAQKLYDEISDEMLSGEIVNFSVVG